MNWKSVKTSSEVVLEGVSVEVETVDGAVVACVLSDESGNKVRCAIESYNFRISIPAPPPTKDVYVVSGRVRGTDIIVERQFDDFGDALKCESSLSEAYCEDVKREERKVPAE